MAIMAATVVEPFAFGNALPQIAALFQAEWQRLRNCPAAHSSATIRADLLTVALPNALTCGESVQSATETGRSEVKQQLDGWIDLAYPRLAAQIEALLHCYVTWTEIDLAADNSTVNVRIGLRELPMF
jgi:hypothetical protein